MTVLIHSTDTEERLVGDLAIGQPAGSQAEAAGSKNRSRRARRIVSAALAVVVIALASVAWTRLGVGSAVRPAPVDRSLNVATLDRLGSPVVGASALGDHTFAWPKCTPQQCVTVGRVFGLSTLDTMAGVLAKIRTWEQAHGLVEGATITCTTASTQIVVPGPGGAGCDLGVRAPSSGSAGPQDIYLSLRFANPTTVAAGQHDWTDYQQQPVNAVDVTVTQWAAGLED